MPTSAASRATCRRAGGSGGRRQAGDEGQVAHGRLGANLGPHGKSFQNTELARVARSL